MVYVKRHIDLTKTENNKIDKDVDSGMMSGITDENKFQDVNIMGAIVHPLFQRNLRMVTASLCTETQYESGTSYFLDRMASYFEGRDEYPLVLLDPEERYEYDKVRDSVAISPYAKDAEKELEDFND